jgi:hypothetical protein
MRRLYFSLSLLLALLTACGQNAQTGTIGLASPTLPATAVDSVEGITSLADALRANGVAVNSEGAVSLAFLNGTGEILRVDEQSVQVYEYADEGSANGDAARFSQDGAWVSGEHGSTLINWFDTPHLYRATRLIAVYVGDHAPTLTLLENVLGAPFAGGANPYNAAALLRTED